MSNPSENPPAFPTPGELARVRELATILERFGLFASQDRVTELSSLAPRLADECERLKVELSKERHGASGLCCQLRQEAEAECERLRAEKAVAEACGKVAVDSCEVLEKENIQLRSDLARANDALKVVASALDAAANVFDNMDSVQWMEDSAWDRSNYAEASDEVNAAVITIETLKP